MTIMNKYQIAVLLLLLIGLGCKPDEMEVETSPVLEQFDDSHFRIIGSGLGFGQSIARTTDNGLIILAAGTNVTLVKLDDVFNVQWIKTYDRAIIWGAFEVIETSDLGFALVGSHRESINHPWETVLLKTDSDGNMRWRYTHKNIRSEGGASFVETANNDFLVVGYISTDDEFISAKDLAIHRIDGSGNELWHRTENHYRLEQGRAILECADNEYLIVSSVSESLLSPSIFLTKIDETGGETWTKDLSRFTDITPEYSMISTNSGGFIISCTQEQENGLSRDGLIIELDKDGNELWSSTVGGKASESIDAITAANDGGFVVTGNSNSYGKEMGVLYLAKLDADGTLLWERQYGVSGHINGADIIEAANGDLLITGVKHLDGGSPQNQLILLVTDSDGRPK